MDRHDVIDPTMVLVNNSTVKALERSIIGPFLIWDYLNPRHTKHLIAFTFVGISYFAVIENKTEQHLPNEEQALTQCFTSEAEAFTDEQSVSGRGICARLW
jgi:hypothetical protein|tara:strand:+ start:2972 stop:3274 length:303 start_codon:yes stop_codon:yes gene_type:complete